MGDRESVRPQVLLLGRGIRIDWTKVREVKNAVPNGDWRETNWLYPVPVLSGLFGNVAGPFPVGWVI